MSMKQGELTKEITVAVNNSSAVSQVFTDEEFGDIRTITINSEPWFAAVDVCRALEIKNVSDALKRLDDDERMTIDLTDSHSGQRGGAQSMIFVNEPGLYSLVLSSRKPGAKRFKRWITHDVIPALRKTGSYSVKPLTATQMFIAAAKVLEEQDQRLSIVENGLGNVVTNVSSLTESVADINKRLDHEEQVNAFTSHMLDIKDRKQQKQLDQHEEDIQQLKQDRFIVKEDISADIKGFINKVFNHYPHFYEQGQKNGKAEVYKIFYGAVSEGAGHSSTYISTLISERRRRLISQGLSEATAKQKVTGISVINSDPQLRTAAMGVIKNVEDIMKTETEGETNA